MDKIKLLEIFECKLRKSEFVNSQSYEAAAKVQDIERNLEKEILISTGVCLPHNEKIHLQFSKLFKKEFGLEYPKLYNEHIHKLIIRELKLIDLGI